jgi:prepilin-type N-terminal cleavage/methylation domain-containing protein
MQISARPAAAARPTRRAAAGFTLIEIMCALGIFALLVLPMLVVRQSASNMAFRSNRMLTALSYSDKLLAERMTNPERVNQLLGVVETDPDFHWELTLEDYDLSTGRVDEPQNDGTGFSDGTNFSTVSAFANPSDAGAPTDTEADISSYKVRRYKLTMWYPGQHDDNEDKLVLEGYIPRATDAEATSLLGAK